jgi:pimeloyl-ACP methyl ester carboxylesterase
MQSNSRRKEEKAKEMAENFMERRDEQMIDLPAGRFHYVSWGAERSELPAAVLLHGITSSALSWVRVGPALAERYRVYAFDMRGHGDSVHPPSGEYGLRRSADDAAAFLTALGLERPYSLATRAT